MAHHGATAVVITASVSQMREDSRAPVANAKVILEVTAVGAGLTTVVAIGGRGFGVGVVVSPHHVLVLGFFSWGR